MELSDLLKLAELPRDTILESKDLNAYGLYDTGRTLGKQVVYWGVSKGSCVLDVLEDGKLKVYTHQKSHS